MSPDGVRFGKRFLVCAIMVAAIPSVIVLLPGQTDDLGKLRRTAQAQHEIVMLLIEKKEYAKAGEEANKIFQMKWPDGQESLLLYDLLGFSDRLRHAGQPAIALRLLETNYGTFKDAKSKAEIWMDKGYLYKEMGQPEKALECFKEAQRWTQVTQVKKK